MAWPKEKIIIIVINSYKFKKIVQMLAFTRDVTYAPLFSKTAKNKHGCNFPSNVNNLNVIEISYFSA